MELTNETLVSVGQILSAGVVNDNETAEYALTAFLSTTARPELERTLAVFIGVVTEMLRVDALERGVRPEVAADLFCMAMSGIEPVLFDDHLGEEEG